MRPPYSRIVLHYKQYRHFAILEISTNQSPMYYNAVMGSMPNQKRETPIYCNNCGKYGHNYSHCKNLITSYGVIAFRWNPEINTTQYLLICRKNTLGFMDFIRGKYVTNDNDYIYNMITQMTETETKYIMSGNFENSWNLAFGNGDVEMSDIPNIDLSFCGIHLNDSSFLLPQIDISQADTDKFNKTLSLKNEKNISQEKYRQLSMKRTAEGVPTLSYLIKKSVESGNVWNEPEWGFPKGRRNYRESDYDCAIREFCEETGFDQKVLRNVQNVVPFEEIFMGSNYKSYKHRYYLVNIPYVHSQNMESFERAEVSKMEWKTYEECIRDIRPYNLEKRRLITNIHLGLQRYRFVSD